VAVAQIRSHVTSFDGLRTNTLGEFGLDEGPLEHLGAATKYIDVADGRRASTSSLRSNWFWVIGSLLDV
jgi:hypothetical protein